LTVVLSKPMSSSEPVGSSEPVVLSEPISMGQSTSRLFTAIPPERVGLDGEYDHDGLAKRVSVVFGQNFELGELGELRISQRGSVVVLMGEVPNQRLLIKLVTLAMNVSGAVDVEINGVCVAEPLRFYLEVKPSKEAMVNLLSLVNHR
jgi:hypothetical protein